MRFGKKGKLSLRFIGPFEILQRVGKVADEPALPLSLAGVHQREGQERSGYLVDRELKESVVEVRRVNERLIAIKLVVGGSSLNVISAYAPQASLDDEVKRRFWDALDDVVRGIPSTEKLFIGEYSNGHIGSSAGGYGEVHGGFGFGDRNGGGTLLLDFARAFELVIVNFILLKREEHLVTFLGMVVKTQILYLLLMRCDRGM
ncbi:uncharacterized protein [Nicotiana sylvestris]